MRIVVTGGSGFMGRALIRKLFADGFSGITSISKSGTVDGVENAACDLASPGAAAELARIFRRGDAVVHLAWAGVGKPMNEGSDRDAQANLEATRVVAEAGVAAGIAKLVFVSSGGTVYGDTGSHPFKETDRCEPMSLYGRSKLAAERIVEETAARGLPCAILRLSNLYGRSALGSGAARWAVDSFVANAKAGRPIIMNGDSSTIRDYIHADDAIGFIARAAVDPTIAGTYNVGTGVGTSLADIVRAIERVSGAAPAIERRPKPATDLPYNVLDISKVLDTGWKPTHSLNDDIRAMYNAVA